MGKYANESAWAAEASRLVNCFIGKKKDFPNHGVVYFVDLFIPAIELGLRLYDPHDGHLLVAIAFLIHRLAKSHLA